MASLTGIISLGYVLTGEIIQPGWPPHPLELLAVKYLQFSGQQGNTRNDHDRFSARG
ncbi:MAG: hypothetical protein HPY59_17375 [Anaerolineae bacterium]|nr:hypothetical protein [Anaerolineae bacterium]